MARDKTVPETAQETVAAAPGRRVIAVLTVTDGLAEIRRAIATEQHYPASGCRPHATGPPRP